MARRVKQPLSEADAFLTKYIDQTLANTGKIRWSSEEVTACSRVMNGFLEDLESEMDFHLKTEKLSCLKEAKHEPETSIREMDKHKSRSSPTMPSS
ncbi:hypothetical protein [Turicimonas muris]|uniref:hypothetical protein n=1 Tax=Turicimonas muris TaxID=1796652 RepID=UPI003F664B9C